MARTSLLDRIAPAADDGQSADAAENRNAAIQLASLSMTKLADGLIDPKLVLAWLLGALGAPVSAIGALVPVREAGALLPQLLLAGLVARAARRKWFWVAGSAVQGAAALAIAAAALMLQGAAAAWAIVGALAILAMARAACSVSHKDTLARTVAKTRRGAVSGAAGTVGAAAVLVFGGLLAAGVLPMTPLALSLAVGLAGLLWLAAACLFPFLDEPPGEAGGSDGPFGGLFTPLREDAQLRRFVAVRALLTSTALAVPYLVMLEGMRAESGLGNLGPLVLASGLATILAAYVWGRISDRSSRTTLIVAAWLAGAVFAAAAISGGITGGLGGLAGTAAAVFVVQIAYEGVRSGRKIQLTDMADDSERARYTALSNTIIGLTLVAGGSFGLVAEAVGPAAVIAIFSAMCLLGGALALGLDEVQTAA